jgi:hypothetical protein
MDLGDPIVTEAGIMKDDQVECQTFIGRIAVEVDTHLEQIDGLEGIEMPDRINDPGFVPMFDDTAKRLYRTITGRDCPKTVKVL